MQGERPVMTSPFNSARLLQLRMHGRGSGAVAAAAAFFRFGYVCTLRGHTLTAGERARRLPSPARGAWAWLANRTHLSSGCWAAA
jgi:hypothetical protein